MNAKEIFRALQTKTMSAQKAEQELLRLLEGAGSIPASSNAEHSLSISAGKMPTEEPELAVQGQPVVRLSEPESGIALITMQDREHKNTFSFELIMGLMQTFASIQENQNYKVVIITGYDHYFACGGSQEGMAAIQAGTVKLTDIALYRLPLDCKVPVIAAMQGHGIGGGWCLGLFSDFIVMSKEASYTCNHMDYGFTPGDGATLIFPAKFGMNLGQEIIFTGKKYRGFELAAKGAPLPILPRDEVLPYAMELARSLARAPRESLVLLKAHQTESIRARLPEIIEKEWEMQQKTFVNRPEIMAKIRGAFAQPGVVKPASDALGGAELQETTGEKPVSGQKTLEPELKATRRRSNYAELLLLNRNQPGRPVFWIHSEGGGVEGYQAIARNVKRPFYGIQASGRTTEEKESSGLPELVSRYMKIITTVQPDGPYDLGGYSLGGALAYEMIRQLQLQGQKVNTIVMVDSLDGNQIKRVKVSPKALILQAVNLVLIQRLRQEPATIIDKLIQPSEVNDQLDADEYLLEIIRLGQKRGLSRKLDEMELWHLFRQNLKQQNAFDLKQLPLLPLSHPQEVICHYFRNGSGLFYGEFEPYFSGGGSKATLDQKNYWKGWQQLLPNFQLHDLGSSSHLTMLFEKNVHASLGAFCEALYSQ